MRAEGADRSELHSFIILGNVAVLRGPIEGPEYGLASCGSSVTTGSASTSHVTMASLREYNAIHYGPSLGFRFHWGG
jgi:hypothetical protein